MNVSKTASVLVALQGETWGITVESGSVVRVLETRQRLDARSDAFALQTLRFLDLIERDPDNAVEYARLGKVAQVNAITLDSQEDECCAEAMTRMDKIRTLARRCSDWIKVTVGGKQPTTQRKKIRSAAS